QDLSAVRRSGGCFGGQAGRARCERGQGQPRGGSAASPDQRLIRLQQRTVGPGRRGEGEEGQGQGSEGVGTPREHAENEPRRARWLREATHRLALGDPEADPGPQRRPGQDRKSTRLNSSHRTISYAVFCLKKKHPSSPSRSLTRAIS